MNMTTLGYGCREHEWIDETPRPSWRNAWNVFRTYWHYKCSKCPMSKLEDCSGREVAEFWHGTLLIEVTP